MKTNFESEEDQWYLYQILMRAIMTTENLFEMNTPELFEYRDLVIKTRAKIFEYLEQIDPNHILIEKIKNNTFSEFMGINNDTKQ